MTEGLELDTPADAQAPPGFVLLAFENIDIRSISICP